ncbi:phage tail terminator family protein [Scatolibacter rhodanostii]|uniref:phage tail terminator family protein n=1 Tax=Scatolibacter rhodanostii TaxID=2014781 RepID=UPI000C070B95|nr:hypothetical protein [Scatolibacter rhodanostii]
MVNEVIGAVSRKLKQVYGHTVYGAEKPMQEFKTPSFLITLLDMSDTAKLGKRFSRQIALNIQHFSENEENLVEAWTISGTILKELEWLTLPNNDLIRAEAMRCEVIDGTLNAFLTYTLPMTEKVVAEPDMENLELIARKEP